MHLFYFQKKGGTSAFIMRLPFNQIKTVALETGIQNVGVAFLIIYTNLPSPDADYAAFPIIAIAFMTPAPLYLLYIIIQIVKWVRGKKDKSKKPKEVEAKTSGPESTPMMAKE